MIRIPFNKPFLIGKELEYIAQAVSSGHVSGDGLFTRKCSEFLETLLNARRVLLTTSCTAALEMAAILCDVGPETEFVVPSFTFVSTANAFYSRGAKPVFVDIREDTLNMDERQVEAVISARTRAIVPVHYGGRACEMDTILAVAKRHALYVIEDAAQGLGEKYGNLQLGTLGDIGAFSFHETKNVQCGEGGAIVINNDRFIERAEIVREKGTDRSRFFRGQVDKYTWVDIGSSYLPSDILAAYLYAQLENMERITAARANVVRLYHEALAPLAQTGHLRVPAPDPNGSFGNHLFYVLLETGAERDRLMEHLRSKGILAVFHYLPLHLSSVGQSLGYRAGQLPVTESVSERLLRLPVFYGLTSGEQLTVVSAIKDFFLG